MKHVIFLLLVLYAIFDMSVHNDYMHRRMIITEVVDKEIQHNSANDPIYVVKYRIEGGSEFSRPVNEQVWQVALPGLKTHSFLRPIDVQPNILDSIRHVFLPIVVTIAFFMYLIWFLVFWHPTSKEQQ